MKRSLIGFLLLFCFIFHSYGQEMLKESDIKEIMKQILNQHLGKKEVTAQVLQNAITIYIDQFDPNRMYLLQSEIEPFTKLSEADLSALLNDYKHNDFSPFVKLNKLFKNSIERSRKLRAKIENNLQNLPTEKNSPDSFANSEAELKERIASNLDNYILTQKMRYGESYIKQKKEALLKSYEEQLREFENQYLFQDEKGAPLPANEQQNLLSIQILKALASSLDAHTSFFQSNEAFDFRLRLQKEFQGLGLGFADTPNGATVHLVMPDGPAAKNGEIQIGDILTNIDGRNVSDYSFEKIMEELHDETKQELSLTFVRPTEEGKIGSTYRVTLKRQLIIVNSDRVDVQTVKFGQGIIGIITLHSFYQGDDISSEKDVRNALEKLEAQGNLKGVILDLRDNRGGFLTQAVKVASLFISNGIIVISKYDNGDEHFYRDVDGKTIYDGPLVVLTSKITASAAEIVAQALQDYGVALIVGDERTYGKGTIQTQTVTDNQSSTYFKVTVGKYYTVSGKTPQKEGVKADIVVPGRWNDQEVGEKYADSVDGDTIQPSYEDPLLDVTTENKKWFLKYYMPKLQHRVSTWRSLLPGLRKNSEYRIDKNKNYQFFLKGGESVNPDEEEDWLAADNKTKNYGIDDFQLDEAVNIVKDMYMMHTAEKN